MSFYLDRNCFVVLDGELDKNIGDVELMELVTKQWQCAVRWLKQGHDVHFGSCLICKVGDCPYCLVARKTGELCTEYTGMSLVGWLTIDTAEYILAKAQELLAMCQGEEE